MTNYHSSPIRSESGQASVLMALLLFFAFLAIAALAIDGGMTYLVRRDLQNVADSAALAACRVIATNEVTATTPIQAAQNVVTAHLGSSALYVGDNPPSTNLGEGAGLVKGIEADSTTEDGKTVYSPIVRVAVQRRVPTVLTQFVGRGDSIMLAQARCDTRAGGGPLPIAVQRYDGGPGRTQRDHLANKLASGYPPGAPVYQYADPTYSYTATVPGRYSPPDFQVPVPKSQYEASDGGKNDANTGPEVAILGQGARSNNTPNEMNGFVMLDIRNVGSGNAIEYYNGVEGQAAVFKDVSQNYIYIHGYPGPFPQIGSEVAVLPGVSANFAPHAVKNSGYRIGDIIPVIVYDGYVWSTPEFNITITPQAPNSNGIKSSSYPDSQANAVQYIVTIAAANKWPPSTSLNFDISLWFSGKDESPVSPPASTHIIRNSNGQDLMASGMNFTVNNVAESSPWTDTLLIYSDSAGPNITQTQKYLGGLSFKAEASSGLIKGASTNYGFGNVAEDYALRTESGGAVIRQNDSQTVSVLTYVDNASPSLNCNNNATATAEVWNASGTTKLNWNTYFSSGQPSGLPTSQATSVKLKKGSPGNPVNSGDFTLVTSVEAPKTPPPVTLRVTVSGCGAPSHSVDIPITIIDPANAPETKQFVFIQGYALFRISDMQPTIDNPNTIYGYAISPLVFDYSQISQGRQPRLVPWD